MNPKQLNNIKKQIKNLPTTAGLYFMKDEKQTVLYIGKANNIKSRVSSYFQPSADIMATRGAKIAEMLNKVQCIDYLQTADQVEAVLQEARLIKDIRPPYNSDLTDDKSFPYLEITVKDDFPAVFVTRRPENKNKLFGPFTTASELRASVVLLQKIFKFRTCKLAIKKNDDKRRFFRPCLLYSIKQCSAPCADKISRQDYRKIIKDLVSFLGSKRITVLKKLKKDMQNAADEKNYELAAIYRDRIRLIENLDKRGSANINVQPEVMQFIAQPAAAVEELTKIFASATAVRVIEGFDIAHIQGKNTVASMVRFIDGRPFKAGYRRYKIKTVSGIDDYASIKEVLLRRYHNMAEGNELQPDLVLIDGGLGQLNAAKQAFKQLGVNVPHLASLAKKEEIIFIAGQNEPLKLPANNAAKKLLQYVRDEAHRFAQHYLHLLQSKNITEK